MEVEVPFDPLEVLFDLLGVPFRDWKPPAGQVEHRLLRPAWSQQRDQPVWGQMWSPVVAPRKPPQAPCSSQAATQPAASKPGPSNPQPAKRSKCTEAEPAAEPTQPTKGKGQAKDKAAKAKPAPQPGRWVDRDCNAALNMQRIGESRLGLRCYSVFASMLGTMLQEVFPRPRMSYGRRTDNRCIKAGPKTSNVEREVSEHYVAFAGPSLALPRVLQHNVIGLGNATPRQPNGKRRRTTTADTAAGTTAGAATSSPRSSWITTQWRAAAEGRGNCLHCGEDRSMNNITRLKNHLLKCPQFLDSPAAQEAAGRCKEVKAAIARRQEGEPAVTQQAVELTEQEQFGEDVMRLAIDNNWSFHFVEHATTQAFFKKWLPHLKLPSRDGYMVKMNLSPSIFHPRLLRDPVTWWEWYGKKTPVLQQVAQRVLSIPATSAGVERLFSVFKFIWSDRRNRLLMGRMWAMAYVYFNTRALRHLEEPMADDDADVARWEEWMASQPVEGPSQEVGNINVARLLLEWLLRDGLPLTIVESDAFLEFVRALKPDWPAKVETLQSAMKGKKRKGAKEPKQPNPKQPKPKPKGKPDDLGWVGPVSPQGRALKERLKEAANSRIQFVKCYLKGFIRGRNNVKNKIVAHLRLRMGIHHKQRKLASLAVLVLLAKCLVGPPTPGTFYDRDVSAALNIRRCAVGPGPRPTELCYWDGRPAMPKRGRPGQEWAYLPDKALLHKWRRKWRQ
ncbi:hypothetical protein QJQ45_011782 [Haematococcus lacustris]|nr:hypothetical protein QJQ45_011782 [Haematococcus lacustris]